MNRHTRASCANREVPINPHLPTQGNTFKPEVSADPQESPPPNGCNSWVGAMHPESLAFPVRDRRTIMFPYGRNQFNAQWNLHENRSATIATQGALRRQMGRATSPGYDLRAIRTIEASLAGRGPREHTSRFVLLREPPILILDVPPTPLLPCADASAAELNLVNLPAKRLGRSDSPREVQDETRQSPSIPG